MSLFISAMIISLASCGTDGKSVVNDINTEQTQEEVMQEQSGTYLAQVEEQEPAVDLTKVELWEFTELINTDEYNGFLEESFNSPEEINWDSVLEFGAGLSVQNISEDEINDYLEAKGEKKLYGDLFVIRKSDLEDYIIKHTGLNNLKNDVLSWDYVQKHDSYYKEHWSEYQKQYTCVLGRKAGDHYELRFKVNSEDLPGLNAGKNYGIWADRILKLTKTTDGMVIESNEIQWDDYCDEEQTFDIELSQYDEPVHFVTYSVNPNEADITIVKGGKFLSDLPTAVYSEDGNNYLKRIIDVGFFDFNSDGRDDIAVIGDSDLGKYVLLYVSVLGDYQFKPFADLNEEKMSEIGSDFTIAGIKKTMLGDSQKAEYSSYQELYTHLAKVYNMQDDKNQDHKNQYDLIYADDDDIPEFVVGHSGSFVSLITYEDGKAHYLMNGWSFGIGGNSGYSYAPRKEIYYNENADYAGAVCYSTYMSKRDVGELGIDYRVKELNFIDLDGDGWPSVDEPLTTGGSVGSLEYYNGTDKEMSDEEIKAVISLYESYERKPIMGRMDYPTFLDKLDGKEVGITDEQALAAIKKFCLKSDPDLISYHSTGSVIYWDYGSSGEVYEKDAELAGLVSSLTGYERSSSVQSAQDAAGCSDYFVLKEYIPPVTIENGYSACPIGIEEFPSIWASNAELLPALAYNYSEIQ